MEAVEFEDKNQSEYLLELKDNIQVWEKKLFSVLSTIYVLPKLGSTESTYRKTMFYAYEFLVATQYASMIWTLNTSISNWSEFNILWYPIYYTRFDGICAQLKVTEAWIILVWTLCSTLFLTVSSVIILSWLNKKLPSKLMYLVKKILSTTEFMSTNFFIVLVLVLKYSWTALEGSQNVDMDYSTFGIVMSLGCLIVIVILRITGLAFDYDCRHVQASASFKTKSNSSFDLLSTSIEFTSIFLYAFDSDFVFYRGLLMALHAIGAVCFCYYLPYYNFYANFSKSLPHVFVFLSGLITIVGYRIDSALFCVLGFIILNPLGIYIWYCTFNYRISKIRFDKLHKVNSLWEFELSMRDRLVKYDQDQVGENLEQFNKAFNRKKFQKIKIFVIWEASYYFFQCKNERLGLIKLSSNSKVKSSIEEDYQTYFITKDMKKVAFEYFEEYKIIYKLQKIEKVKKIDKETCLEACNFSSHILSHNPRLRSLETSSINFKQAIQKLEKKYSDLFSKYPDSSTLIDLYSSFVESFYGDTERSSIILSRKERVKDLTVHKQLKNIIEENPLMLVSAASPDFGLIKYCNEELANLLQSTQTNINKQAFTDFFPNSIKALSLESLKNFELSLSSTTIYIEDDLFILNSREFLIEVSIIIILVGFYTKFFLFSIKKLEIDREVCLIHKKKILYHTEGLENLIKIKDIRNHKIENVLNISLEDLKRKENTEVIINSYRIVLVYKKIPLKNQNLKILYFYLSKKNYMKSAALTSSANLNNYIKSAALPSSANFNTNKKFRFEDEEETTLKDLNTDKNIIDSELSASADKSLASLMSSQWNPKSQISRSNLYVDGSIRALKYFKRILLISVIFKQVIITTSFNFGLLIYVIFQINLSLNQNSIDILGQTLYSIISLANSNSIVQLIVSTGVDPLSSIIPRINETETILFELLNNYTNFNSNWDYCAEAKILFQDSIPVIETKGTNKKISYVTMYNFLTEFLSTVKNI